MAGGMWLAEWAGQLAELSDSVLSKVPDTEDWEVIRHFLSNVSGLLRRGDIKAGARALFKILPYIQRTLSSVEKTMNIANTYEITETISQHFLVDESAREELEDFLKHIKLKMDTMRSKVESFAQELDLLVEDVIQDGHDISLYVTLRLAFRMSRISALIRACEDGLATARHMLDTLDTHVATKNMMARILSIITFIIGIVFSATGNLPASAACFTAATASRKSAKNLEDYRQQLSAIDKEHRKLQAELTAWRHQFRAEQTNFLFLLGLRRAAMAAAALAIAFVLLGKAANFLIFAAVVLYLVARSEERNEARYYAGLGLAVLAMFLEYEGERGMVMFNLGASVFIGLNFLGFIEL